MNKATTASQDRTREIVMTALMAALACVATKVLNLPTPTGGYLNTGDAVVLLGAFLLGPWYGAAAGGIGSALADLLGGYMAYVPATLVIKAAMAMTAGLLYRKLGQQKSGLLLCGIAGELPMVLGYWLYEAWMLRSFAGSAAGIPGNLAQAAFGIVAAALLASALRRSGEVRRRFPRL